jgi:hypothetical protein
MRFAWMPGRCSGRARLQHKAAAALQRARHLARAVRRVRRGERGERGHGRAAALHVAVVDHDVAERLRGVDELPAQAPASATLAAQTAPASATLAAGTGSRVSDPRCQIRLPRQRPLLPEQAPASVTLAAARTSAAPARSRVGRPVLTGASRAGEQAAARGAGADRDHSRHVLRVQYPHAWTNAAFVLSASPAHVIVPTCVPSCCRSA